MIVFDIETEVLPLSEIEQFIPPFEPAAEMPDFDPTTVALGNLKDEAKRAAKIEEARKKHEVAKAEWPNLVAQAKAEHVAKFLDRAALSATTARVLVIGYYSVAKDRVVIDHADGDESKLLANFWQQYKTNRANSKKMVGLNIFDFDLPFIARRSWLNGIDVPETAFDGRYWDRLFVDLRRRWLCGQHFSACESNFDALGKAFGTGGKNGQSGADFARLWHEDRNAAIAYLTQDLKQPAAWAARMGLI